MSVQSIGTSALDSVAPVSANQSTPQALTNSNNGGASTSTQISGSGQFLSKLQQLEQTDPAKAKQILTSIANKLQQQASQATGTQATQLNQLAAKFQNAASTGNLSGLQPPPGGAAGHHHHGGHGKAKQAYSQANDQSSSLLDVLSENASTVSAAA